MEEQKAPTVLPIVKLTKFQIAALRNLQGRSIDAKARYEQCIQDMEMFQNVLCEQILCDAGVPVGSKYGLNEDGTVLIPVTKGGSDGDKQ